MSHFIPLILTAYVLIGLWMAERLAIGFVFLTHLDKVKKENGNVLPRAIWIAGAKTAVKTAIIDVLFNLFYGSIILVSIPRLWGKQTDWTFSQHLSRYWNDDPSDSSYRKLVGKWVKDNLWIDKFDYTGLHIHFRG